MITVLTIDDREGALEEALQVFKKLSLSLSRIESRPSKTFRWKYDILLEVRRIDEQQLAELKKQLPSIVSSFQFIQSEAAAADDESSSPDEGNCLAGNAGRLLSIFIPFQDALSVTPWFPKRLEDMDAFVERVLECGEELSADHPGFTDPEYRARRAEITQLAKKFRT